MCNVSFALCFVFCFNPRSVELLGLEQMSRKSRWKSTARQCAITNGRCGALGGTRGHDVSLDFLRFFED